jgi:hypothetical protein
MGRKKKALCYNCHCTAIERDAVIIITVVLAAQQQSGFNNKCQKNGRLEAAARQ